MNIKHIILCIEFAFLAVQLIMLKLHTNLRQSTEKLLRS
nr:MAG TPA: hypothetical protein [Bacteriophage sp.]